MLSALSACFIMSTAACCPAARCPLISSGIRNPIWAPVFPAIDFGVTCDHVQRRATLPSTLQPPSACTCSMRPGHEGMTTPAVHATSSAGGARGQPGWAEGWEIMEGRPGGSGHSCTCPAAAHLQRPRQDMAGPYLSGLTRWPALGPSGTAPAIRRDRRQAGRPCWPHLALRTAAGPPHCWGPAWPSGWSLPAGWRRPSPAGSSASTAPWCSSLLCRSEVAGVQLGGSLGRRLGRAGLAGPAQFMPNGPKVCRGGRGRRAGTRQQLAGRPMHASSIPAHICRGTSSGPSGPRRTPAAACGRFGGAARWAVGGT